MLVNAHRVGKLDVRGVRLRTALSCGRVTSVPLGKLDPSILSMLHVWFVIHIHYAVTLTTQLCRSKQWMSGERRKFFLWIRVQVAISFHRKDNFYNILWWQWIRSGGQEVTSYRKPLKTNVISSTRRKILFAQINTFRTNFWAPSPAQKVTCIKPSRNTYK